MGRRGGGMWRKVFLGIIPNEDAKRRLAMVFMVNSLGNGKIYTPVALLLLVRVCRLVSRQGRNRLHHCRSSRGTQQHGHGVRRRSSRLPETFDRTF